VTIFAALSLGAHGRTEQQSAPAAADADWLARARQHISELEYRASRNAQGLQAPNRAHGLRTYFSGSGIQVQTRDAASRDLAQLKLHGVGREGGLAPVPEGIVSGRGARVEIRRPGLLEWYENSPQGLEQGFTLLRRPEGEGALVLELDVGAASASLRGGQVWLTAPTGRRLAYGKLAVTDAGGRALSARLELASAGRVRILVKDAEAAYPVVIDPLLTSTFDSELEPDRSGAELGYSVAGAGDVNGDGYDDLIVGAIYYDGGEDKEGAAFVFLGSASGIPSGDPAVAATRIESDQVDAQLGRSVAGAGDVNGDGYDDVIVGAWVYDAGEVNEGAAFVFLGSATGIASGSSATAAAQLESDLAGAHFGRSVAGAGDVNGDGYDDVIVAGEAVETAIFHGSAAGIADGTPATAATRLALDWASVAGAGDVNGDGYDDVIVGDPNDEIGERAAFVFLGSPTGVADGDASTAATRLDANQPGSRFGWSVAGAGDVNGDGYADVVVGAPRYIEGSTRGAVFLFHGGAAGIPDGDPSTAASHLQSDQASWDGFGWSVAGAGDVNGDGYDDVIVGDPEYSASEDWGDGVAFVFLGGSAGVADGGPASAVARLDSIDWWDGYGGMGFSVAGAGDVNGDGYDDVVAGHPYYAVDNVWGVALVSLGGPKLGLTILESFRSWAGLGWSVASAGDVNGDGYDDVIVGAPSYNARGAAFLFLGAASGIPKSNLAGAATRLESNQAGARFGWSVAGAGDVNGDGYDDVIVGAPYYDTAEGDAGAAFVFHGSATGIDDGGPATAATVLEGDQGFGWLGYDVAGAGDVNGDGYDDVIVGAPYYNTAEMYAGAAFVFHGSASGIPSGDASSAAARLEADWEDSFYGESVAGAGDVNGDGYDDVIVGSVWGCFVFHGSASGISSGGSASADTQLSGESEWWQIEFDVAGAGDVNGDGYDDVIVNGREDAPLSSYVTRVAFVFHGSATGIASGGPASAAARLDVSEPAERVLMSLAGAGDVNGDGFDDVIVGYRSGDYDELIAGGAFVFPGGASGVADTGLALPMPIGQEWAFGASVAGAGDVNGDGLDDMIVGGPEFGTPGLPKEGAALVFLGEADADADGVGDATDNCVHVRNPSQTDADGDSFGNACDGDFDQDGYAGIPDFTTLVRCWGSAIPASGGPPADPTCAESDMDADGSVETDDFELFLQEYGTPPGS